jgi:exonuclease SbcD
VGGTDQVAVDCFDGFMYTALGHLHSPQTIASPRVRYSGSLLKYSKSEAAKSKSVTLANLESSGAVIRELPLVPKRDVREVEGLLADLESGTGPVAATDDYLYVKLLDRAMPVNAMARLRVRFPNVVDVDVSTAIGAVTGAVLGPSLLELDDITLFDSFMRTATGAGLSPEDRELVAVVLASVDSVDGEVVS